MAYNIIFYENLHGESEIWNFLETLRQKSVTNKNARIQYNQAMLYLQLLQDNGTMLPNNITKHIDENIWEIRPCSNRIFYFCCANNSIVLLHSFRKKTQKTYVKTVDPVVGKYIEEIEEQSAIISAVIQKRIELGISQRDLAAICGIPQSSVARIESQVTTPRLDTLLKILCPLGLHLTVSK